MDGGARGDGLGWELAKAKSTGRACRSRTLVLLAQSASGSGFRSNQKAKAPAPAPAFLATSLTRPPRAPSPARVPLRLSTTTTTNPSRRPVYMRLYNAYICLAIAIPMLPPCFDSDHVHSLPTVHPLRTHASGRTQRNSGPAVIAVSTNVCRSLLFVLLASQPRQTTSWSPVAFTRRYSARVRSVKMANRQRT